MTYEGFRGIYMWIVRHSVRYLCDLLETHDPYGNSEQLREIHVGLVSNL